MRYVLRWGYLGAVYASRRSAQIKIVCVKYWLSTGYLHGLFYMSYARFHMRAAGDAGRVGGRQPAESDLAVTAARHRAHHNAKEKDCSVVAQFGMVFVRSLGSCSGNA